MKKLLILPLLLMACAANEHAPDEAYDKFIELRDACAQRGGTFVVTRRQYSGAKKGYTLMDLRGARCK